MRAIVFSGPSLPPAAVPNIPGIEWRPPLKQGDLHRAALQRPDAIIVIDGYFETTPTVWHDEILFALSTEIEVYGAASTGALRAAELDAFGMQGVGRIYEWFRDGVLEDDDEVAVLHGPPELAFLALTEPMVNVRATVDAAMRSRVIDGELEKAIIGAAKNIFYKERTWEAIISAIPSDLKAPFGALPSIFAKLRIDQKRLDALEAVQILRGR
jgi:hypothetical protein